ncbi:MAG: DUF2066 domain-containing protein [Magnetococcales bacterium]|nr:DUF2066 domain-containing protein [Magnetococcales bacterium]
MGMRKSLRSMVLVLFWTLIFLPGSAARASENLYRVTGIHLSVDQLAVSKKGQDARSEGLQMARRSAWERLLRRLITRQDRETHRARLTEIERDLSALIERLVVRSEKQRGASLDLEVEITFSTTGVKEALTRIGVPHNQTPFPGVLLWVGMREKGDQVTLLESGHPLTALIQAAAAESGMQTVLPLLDMEDMMNLTWPRLHVGDATLLPWAIGRYGVKEILAVAVEVKKAAASGKPGEGAGGAVQLVRLNEQESARSLQGDVPVAKGDERQLQERLAQTAGGLLQAWMDEWIQGHLSAPGQDHAVSIRLVHEHRLARYGEMLTALGRSPGVSQLRVVGLLPREAHLRLQYQGAEERLMEALARLGGTPERSGNELLVRLQP